MLNAMFLTLASLAPLSPSGQQDLDAAKELADLLNTPVTVASTTAKTVRETPGVVSIITRDEIQACGARDLIDVLRTVPGFDFGYDVQGATGPSMRGIWGYEGKILILWDGIEMNETLYGCARIDQHFPVDQIKRIEIIRGPGSAMYGGYSEVAVIQITSLQASDIQGVGGELLYGRGKDAAYHSAAQAVVAQTWNDMKLTFGAYVGGNAVRSSGTYTDPYGASYEMRDNSRMNPAFFNLGFEAGGFQARAIVDAYNMKQRDNYDAALPSSQTVRESSVNVDARYIWKVNPDLTITPFALWRDQKPFWTDDPVTGYAKFQVNRRRLGVSATWKTREDLTLGAGGEIQRDKAESVPLSYPFPDGSMEASYSSKALYAQAEYSGPVNITLGARWEDHSKAGSAFVPRLAITKAWDDWHIKGLFAYAYRTPAIQNLNLLLDPAKPSESEKTRTMEVEGGVKLGPSLLTLNIFVTKIDKPIFYGSSGQGVGYINQTDTGSKGFELEWKYRQAWGFVNASFSHYRTNNDPNSWTVPGHDDQFLSAAPNKAALTAGIKFAEHWTFGPSLVWLDERYGYDYSATTNGLALKHFSSKFLLNGNLTFAKNNWTGSIGLFDAGDTQAPFIQAYYGHAPLPGTGREVVLKVRYGF